MGKANNAFLDALNAADQAMLRPHIRPVRLPLGKVLQDAETTVSTAYFPQSGVISLVDLMSSGFHTEVGMLGSNSLLGGWAALGSPYMSLKATVQSEGVGFTTPISFLQSAADQSPSLRRLLAGHVHALEMQMQVGISCSMSHAVEERLVRWLLHFHDVSGQREWRITQETLAAILGVQRTTLSTAAHHLKEQQMIDYNHGDVRLLDLEKLQRTTCACYWTARRHQQRIFGEGFHNSSHLISLLLLC